VKNVIDPVRRRADKIKRGNLPEIASWLQYALKPDAMAAKNIG